eukprot:GHVN01095157.1.p1 GENE.GHVN01095157.1~~GHVN01095157.1.p1  ORF type:complete len:113 (-),score=10.29 GHVN01095157.1:54-392(-)
MMQQPVEQELDSKDPVNVINLAANKRLLNLARSYGAICGGIGAGLLGITGLAGMLVFIFASIAASLVVLFGLKGSPTQYFESTTQVFTDQFFNGFLLFVLFWTVAYDITYVF